MTTIGFIGLGNMGGPMARNLAKAGHSVTGFDLSAASLRAAEAAGISTEHSAAAAARGAEVVITMLPEGPHVREVYLGSGGVLAASHPGALLIDCSTIDVGTARDVAAAAAAAGVDMIDAPVSGGVAGAEAASLTFMVGGPEPAFARAQPVLAAMGKTIVHAGSPGAGQAAKICNNMILGVSMIAVAEAFTLAARLGLDARKLFEISSKASGQCWSMTSYCPVPGLVPAAPSNRDYKPGFTAAMMAKDLKLAQQAAHATGTPTPMGAEAQALFTMFCATGGQNLDFSAIIKLLTGVVTER